jgi:hypothetical protein
MSQERSDAGIPIHRHEEVSDGAISSGDPDLVAAIETHVERHIGKPDLVYHELISPHVHVDIHIVMPSQARPAITLVTSGMAERPMADGSHAELMLVLPPTWPTPGSPAFGEQSATWPYVMLQELAWLPHAFDTTLGEGHTVPNGDPAQPYAPDTCLCGALIARPLVQPDGFAELRVGEREIEIFAVIPLHADEMDLKLAKGTVALYDLLDEALVTEILDVGRPSVAPPRKRRRMFRR